MAGFGNTAACWGTMTLNFGSALTPMVGAPTFSINGVGTCTGATLTPTAITWGASSVTPLDATCEDIVAQAPLSATTTVTYPSGTTVDVSMTLAGPTEAVVWSALGSSPAVLEAAGTFAWLDPGQITACLTGGTMQVTLTGAFVIVT